MNKLFMRLFSLLFITLFAGCAGIQTLPMTTGESIEIYFSGPIQLSYSLRDGTQKNFEVVDELELVLENHYNDGDSADISQPEMLITYLRLGEGETDLHIGLDPELKNLLNGSPMYPDQAVREHYRATAELEFTNQSGGLLDNEQPVRALGELVKVVAHRHGYSCMKPTGEVHFVYVDLTQVRACLSPNYLEADAALHATEFTREQMVTMLEGNFRNMLASDPVDDPAARPPLVIKLIAGSAAPDPESDGSEIDPGSGGSSGSASGGCSLGRQADAHSAYPWILLLKGVVLVAVACILRRRASFI